MSFVHIRDRRSTAPPCVITMMIYLSRHVVITHTHTPTTTTAHRQTLAKQQHNLAHSVRGLYVKRHAEVEVEVEASV